MFHVSMIFNYFGIKCSRSPKIQLTCGGRETIIFANKNFLGVLVFFKNAKFIARENLGLYNTCNYKETWLTMDTFSYM